ncbi:LacI family transcriptional regulator [Saccharobesus litoralis]|uniref:LacI family transcriptional regulator n=1 Tax=Saccharobesus litoralis TaxID=2172099 RepID=A0A2S0VV64_9ALTE|nr:LacI family DNA-binding transcriptional regulator [Saccharobesus litoralis]AWB68062.1 LacI family transcriptional regulator [Saccharobesus litoralis]
MKATINDVAKLAGVSIKTVSRVINNEPSVRQNTQDKVREAVRQLNYQPNQSARSLAASKSYVVGFVYDNPNAYYIIDMQQGILNACREKHYELLIHPINSKSDSLLDELKEMLRQSRASGLILTPPLSEMQDVIQMLTEADVNMVRVLSGKPYATETPCVFVDDRTAAYQITEHLIAQGHQAIAFFSGDEEHQSTAERLAGYKAALADHNISADVEWVYSGQYSFESGVENCKAMLAKSAKPSAVFACNDEIAAGTLFAARLNGLDVPSDIAIAGFENNPFSRQTWPKLTTAAQPTQDIANEAAELLFRTLQQANKKQPQACENISFEPQLVVREST